MPIEKEIKDIDELKSWLSSSYKISSYNKAPKKDIELKEVTNKQEEKPVLKELKELVIVRFVLIS